MSRLRDHGLRTGDLEAGPRCSIADVDGVRVGHVTVVRDEPAPPAGRGVARSGVTAIVPRDPAMLARESLRAGVAVLTAGADTTVGREGRVAPALPHDAVLELLEARRRLNAR
jgi:D-aminopeptidase